MAALPDPAFYAALRHPIFASQGKGKPMLNFIKTALRNFPSVREIERDYLNAAVSRYDLERRQREVDNGLFRRSSFDL
ncbi:DUF3563 family protein [Tabrizicola sp.]|uniref:DUF3563 family protein n=1 Tax=Tabrizicola sp. TaxID=2005166 RepID=UPI00273390EE|nr:DUF3563 family protein [Tabrizicola sp.]MDP3647225.1 DUF3563 family protein [Paracoccaceae bacterium]